jgi:hypothetical protein
MDPNHRHGQKLLLLKHSGQYPGTSGILRKQILIERNNLGMSCAELRLN